MVEKKERVCFMSWMRRAHPGVSLARLGRPAQSQFAVEAVQTAWLGWWARAQLDSPSNAGGSTK